MSQVYGQGESVKDLAIGGAIRANYFVKSWDDPNKKKGGELAYDMIRFDVNANYKNVIASGQIRFYSSAYGGILIHHAYMGYKFDDYSEIHLGISQVPFGIQTYASNNWFFNINYYVGLEDDYDMGLKYVYQKEKVGFAAAFYKNSEFPADNFSRYSYDVTGTQNEVNQGNLKFTYTVANVELGASLQVGQLEETATGDLGSQSAYALHAHGTFGHFDMKLQASYYHMSPRGPDKDVVYMSAYGAEYQVATEAYSYTLGLMYSIPIDKGPIQTLDVYNDFGYIMKATDGFADSKMNVLGVGVNMGKMYTYVDWAMGKNHAWLGPEWTGAFAAGQADADWNTRFNINFGYYF
ncbi:hypothetical protein N6H18_06500 [Reichenbachiella agarivorans]|uniref:Phosphate-selective porin O and P n=1 Tax=Reichenbachiella agarivorans TaxID=2979464 RepID=A0ABY6CSY6_9BACT|nr:hypothetical protein [Reichenbachiella agarivorans]UXP33603.1 hypothetical protein N6H18_06500 [Reichenbachiella agarivorans]